MEDGEGDRAVHLVLAGDDDGIEEALLGRRVEGVGQGDRRTQLLCLHHQPQLTDPLSHQRRILPAHAHTHTHTLRALYYCSHLNAY